jgi:hypothetical protein
MPTYFAALTKESDATVVLTSIGRPFNTGYDWNGSFTDLTIYGDPGRTVSYLVMADRDDPVMRQMAHPVEAEKQGREKGKLLNPTAYGYPAEMGVNYRAPKRSEK